MFYQFQDPLLIKQKQFEVLFHKSRFQEWLNERSYLMLYIWVANVVTLQNIFFDVIKLSFLEYLQSKSQKIKVFDSNKEASDDIFRCVDFSTPIVQNL